MVIITIITRIKVFIISLVMILLSCENSWSQQLQWTEPVRTSRDIGSFGVIATDNEGFLVMEENRKEHFLKFIRYDFEQPKPMGTNQIPLVPDENDLRFEQVVQMGRELLLFTSEFSKERSKLQVFVTKLDMTGKPLSDRVLVHYAVTGERENAPDFGVALSPDTTRMLLYFDPPFERKSSESLTFKCYDNSLDLLWEKDILLPYTQDIVQVHHFLLDNTGNIYMMSGRNPSKGSDQWQRPQGGRYVVFFYNPADKKLKEYDISLKDKQVLSVTFALNSTQDVVIAGYYSNDFRFSAAGTFLFTIGAGGSAVKTAAFMPFQKDFIQKMLRNTRMDEAPSLPDYFLDDVYLLGENEILLVGEQYYTSEYTLTDPTTGRQTIEYRFNFDDVIVTRLDSAGRHMWNVKVPKRQYTTSSDGYCSYQCYALPDGLNIFFNDNNENEQKLSALKEGEASLWAGTKNSTTTMVSLTSAGELSRASLVSNKTEEMLFSPGIGNLTPNGKRILGFEGGKSYKFCVVR